MQEAYVAAVESGVQTFAFTDKQAHQQAEFSALARVRTRRLLADGAIVDDEEKVQA